MAFTDNIDLSLFQRVLLHSDGTVTDLISTYYQRPIRVTKLKQKIITTKNIAPLELATETELLQREILLSDVHENHYLYAESFFVLDRMETNFRKQLLETEIPIGLLWQQERSETFREIIDHNLEKNESLQGYFDLATDDQFLSRTYRVHQARQPLGLITEKFPYSYYRNTTGQEKISADTIKRDKFNSL